jgi:hypothetical protein
MSRCTVHIQNNSGRQLDAIVLWHTSTPPSASDLVLSRAVLQGTAVAPGARLNGTAQLTSGSPTDCWSMGVRFQGDGETYAMAGYSGQAFKEYETSDGTTITFIINAYTEHTANQSNITIQYSRDGGGSAFLLNSTTIAIISLGEEIAAVLAELA